MASADSTDLIMKFVLSGSPTSGSAIAAESTTDVLRTSATSKRMLAGFEAGRMFEVERFTFRAGTSGSEQSAEEEASSTKKDLKALAKKGGYQTWRAGGTFAYPVDLQPISFTRAIDKASTILIQNCIDCVSYDSASLIKRKAIGGVASGEVYMRMDFIGVLVIGIDWSDGDEVTETCRFISRSVTISYRPQLPDGTLGAIVSGFWSMVPNEKALVL